MDVALLTMDDDNMPVNSSKNSSRVTTDREKAIESSSASPNMLDESNEILRLLSDPNSQMFARSPKSQLERILSATNGFEDQNISNSYGFDAQIGFPDISSFATLRNSSKTLKCPKCNWHYKYQETMEIHMKEKHSDVDVKCVYCVENRAHPKLARGESYSCGYKPYRCDLCRYSTTTKGNLSIHMQSDKHLHAVQELPNSIANFACAPVSRNSPIDEPVSDAPLVCLICGIFASESVAEMVEHVEKDRSRPSQGDVSMINGCFRCHLCPYNTTLKANFQLHTRTDKHLQKVQTANHLREGARPHTAIYRLANTKTGVQVLCRQCQEVISSTEHLKEHCHFPAKLLQSPAKFEIWRCKICNLELDSPSLASGHMTCHEPSTWPKDTTRTDFKMMEDAAYACAGCGFTTKDISDLEEHAKQHEEESSEVGASAVSVSSNQQTCPLCMECTNDLEKHLITDHKIAESAIEKLLLVDRHCGTAKESTSTDSLPSSSSEFQFRCSQCTMAFRTDAQLNSHSIQHVFSSHHKCPTCSDIFDDSNSLLTHMLEHNKEECEMCSETFLTKEAFMSHLNSARHLQLAKKHLESTMIDLNSSQQIDETSRSFRCNICKQSYPQITNLDIHIRSMAHQSRMNRLIDLLASGEIDGDKQLFEQPGMTTPTINQIAEQNNQIALNDVMSILLKAESDENREGANGLQVLTQIQVYGETKITSLVPGLDDKIALIVQFDDAKAAEIARIDCATCGLQISGILALNLHYEEAHSSSIPNEALKKYGEKILAAIEEGMNGDGGCDSARNASPRSLESNDDEPLEKRIKLENMIPEMDKNNSSAASQMAMFQQMISCMPFMAPPNSSTPFGFPQEMFNQLMNPAAAAAAAAAASNNSPAKRARTRITDDQLKVLRQYFNINNSPTEGQIKEMSIKAGLPEKVIKHWFRNTLFKERQRDKDSPYNFNVPPQMSIDLDTYEKTGETKVVALGGGAENSIKSELNSARATPTIPAASSSASLAEEKKVSSSTDTVKNAAAAAASTASAVAAAAAQHLNLQAVLSQMQQTSSFPFLDANSFMSAAAGPMTQIPQPCNTTSSGRRANRTRFTDFQLRTLQQFFDKQAYPKDDDLEALSKKLQLSPRVIVVWFQNARQKARKIYENQPNHENSDRYTRTPGSNFQCKRCNQVFQRYYELIQHQQKKCYKDDGAALANDNKGVEESLTDEEKAQLMAQQASQISNIDLQKFQPTDLLKLFGATQKSSNDVLLKMCESIGGSSTPTTSSFYKACPYCLAPFREKSLMLEHMQTTHPQQWIIAPMDVDMLPDFDQMLEMKDGALDLSGSSVDNRESISTSPTRSDEDNNVLTEALDDSQFSAFGIQLNNTNSECRSPANSKRYRTHLTPLQVQVMKNVFSDYKTPSMAECECLGNEIGLHKRVVQVWFQNARAKERKTKGQCEDEAAKSTDSKCELCDKQFTTRLSLQDHLFSKDHINLLKITLKKEGVSDVASNSDGPPEKKAKVSTSSSTSLDLNNIPFLSGMLTGLPMFDVNLFGTPIPMLQIPEDVKNQITNDIANGESSTVFSQDGQSVEQLREILADDEKQNVDAVKKDVGWACSSCTNVFQEEKKLREHQKAIQMCNGCNKILTLTQIHYSCKLCSSLFCLQSDYILHLNNLPHIQHKSSSTNNSP